MGHLRLQGSYFEYTFTLERWFYYHDGNPGKFARRPGKHEDEKVKPTDTILILKNRLVNLKPLKSYL